MNNQKKSKIALTCLAAILLVMTLPSIVTAQQTAFGDSIQEDGYSISRNIINRELVRGTIVQDSFIIENKGGSQLTLTLSTTEGIQDIIDFDAVGIIIEPENTTEVSFIIVGNQIGDYNGELILSGGVDQRLPVNITVTNKSLYQDFIVETEPIKKKFTLKEQISFKIDVKKILDQEVKNVTFTYKLKQIDENLIFLLSPDVFEEESITLGTETRDITGSYQIKKTFDLPETINKGEYTFNIIASHNNETTVASTTFTVVIPFLSIKLFGFIPVWLIIVFVSTLVFAFIAYKIIKREIAKRRKYKMQLATKTLPKKGERTWWLGKIAEKNIPAYYEMDRLTTHGVVAGATGGGKSISAQVLIEEALMKNIAVIVFDPTAQWSGMLRKCTDKKMMSFYSKFGLKPTASRAFPGNVRQIKDARQAIDIEKFIVPGHIQIFTLNKLDPSDMDIFVGSVIASIFRSDPKEHPGLKAILVFDEVHRLLPKFGGSGKGFLQIERACREFRKWGLGVMLVSQVLSDFVGEIKANINTEVQMRTRDESDLNRLKTKYGEEVLQSLIKASVGVGMFVNPAYNRGKPYFIQFRPILHNTRRLSDEVLDKYNEYGDIIDDLEYQLEQLEAEKVDTFDLKMELKLVKDKLMTGNFTVVDIYLEGLKPRFDKQWQTLGKKPKKKELELVDTKDVEASLEAAKKEREKWEEKDKKEKPASGGESTEKKPAADKPAAEEKPAEEQKPEAQKEEAKSEEEKK